LAVSGLFAPVVFFFVCGLFALVVFLAFDLIRVRFNEGLALARLTLFFTNSSHLAAGLNLNSPWRAEFDVGNAHLLARQSRSRQASRAGCFLCDALDSRPCPPKGTFR
jgi:hypothetical protein